MCIRDSGKAVHLGMLPDNEIIGIPKPDVIDVRRTGKDSLPCHRKTGRQILVDQQFHKEGGIVRNMRSRSVSYTHLRAHETVLDLVCRLLLEKKKNK